MAQLGFYGGKVTEGGTDGALLLTTNPLKYAAEKGSLGDAVKYALRCSVETNVYNVTISVIGTNPDWLELSADAKTWGSTLFFSNIGSTNTLFFVRANIPADAQYSTAVVNNLVFKYIETVSEQGA